MADECSTESKNVSEIVTEEIADISIINVGDCAEIKPEEDQQLSIVSSDNAEIIDHDGTITTVCDENGDFVEVHTTGEDGVCTEYLLINVPEDGNDVIVLQEDEQTSDLPPTKKQKTTRAEKRMKDGDSSDFCSYAISTEYLVCIQPNCSEVFKNKKERNKHLIDVHKILPFQCPLERCSIHFESSASLSAHVRTTHKNTVHWKCNICKNIFKTYKLLYMHQWIMHDQGLFKCPKKDCTFEATYRKQIYNHIDHRHQMHKHACKFKGCTKSFSTKNELKAHERRIHLLLKPFVCKWPGCSYSSEVCPAVIRHIRTQHFHLPETLRKQKEKNITDNRDPKEFLEVICDPNKVYAVLTPSNFNERLPKKYECKYEGCNKSFLRAANLKIHERVHYGLKPYQCTFEDCKFSAERRETVTQHIRTNHFNLPRSLKEQKMKKIIDSRDPNDFIAIVNDQFEDEATKEAVKAMVETSKLVKSPSSSLVSSVTILDETGKQENAQLTKQDDSNKRNFTIIRMPPLPENKQKRAPRTSNPIKTKPEHVCTYYGCGKVFRRPANLKDHERVHRGIKPYQCAYGSCTFASGRKENVIQHIRTNHFRLPRSVKEQKERQIEDERDPSDFVEVIKELL
ncbi:hypothetical protein RDWZM_009692 [Blomia tropicalis]|uniref:C2H2-type domain-containing protein n=1 Tax=Blomia tropicalis TaxID=40697 RepID=A0A9Q0M3J3_BLOTA|nr:hypothetical protein RDWZM_009692 [Blomia tropicalis]